MAKILVVDDEDSVRKLAVTVLEAHGHTVLEAPNAKEALALVDTEVGGVDLLLADLVMPGMSGRELGRRLHDAWPGLKTLYTSGFTTESKMADGGAAFLAKPYMPRQLAEKVSDVLGL